MIILKGEKMNCPVCGKELYQGSKDIYQEKNNENLFACFYRKCPVSSLGYLDKSNFMEPRDFTIANCIMIFKRDICDGKSDLKQSLKIMKDYPNYEKYGCIDCRWTGIPLITKYVRYLYADRIPRYIYECPVCFSTRIINLKTGKFINMHLAKFQYQYNKIIIFLKKAIKRILSHIKKG